jgi:hypothetical protein
MSTEATENVNEVQVDFMSTEARENVNKDALTQFSVSEIHTNNPLFER